MPAKESKAGFKRDKNSGRDSVSAADRASERINGISIGNSGNPGFKPPPIMPFEHTLAFAFRSSGGKETAISGARLVDDPRFQKMAWAWDQATERDKTVLILEDLCVAAEITPDEFLGTVLTALWKRSVDIAKLTAITAHPRIVEATIEHAQGQWGNADRRMLLDHAGFLPMPKGQTINVGVDARSTVQVATEVQVGKGLPSFEEDGKKINTAVRTELRRLEEAPAPISIKLEPVEAEFVDVPRNQDKSEN